MKQKTWTVLKKGKPCKIGFRADGTYYPVDLIPNPPLPVVRVASPSQPESNQDSSHETGHQPHHEQASPHSACHKRSTFG